MRTALWRTVCPRRSSSWARSRHLNYWRTYGGFEMILVNKDNQITCTKGLMEQFTLANDNYTLRYTE